VRVEVGVATVLLALTAVLVERSDDDPSHPPPRRLCSVHGGCARARLARRRPRGRGVLAAESTTPEGGGLSYTVRLTWANDGHAAIDSTVTATAVGPDGAPQTPVTLTAIDRDGRYQATVPLPDAGPWTVRFTAVQPAGTLEVPDQVPPTTTTTAPPATDTTASSESTPEPAGSSPTASDLTDERPPLTTTRAAEPVVR
jgi:hypothetical protein